MSLREVCSHFSTMIKIIRRFFGRIIVSLLAPLFFAAPNVIIVSGAGACAIRMLQWISAKVSRGFQLGEWEEETTSSAGGRWGSAVG